MKAQRTLSAGTGDFIGQIIFCLQGMKFFAFPWYEKAGNGLWGTEQEVPTILSEESAKGG